MMIASLHSALPPSYIVMLRLLPFFFFLRSSHSLSAFSLLTRIPATGRRFSSTPNAKMSTNPLSEYGLPPLILGSGSFTRKLILKEMGIPFILLVRKIDEKNIGDRNKDDPSNLVLSLGKAKMDHLVREFQAGHCSDDLPEDMRDQSSWVILTADQVVVCNGSILEKPESIEEAKSFVSSYAAHPPSTVGSCVLTHLPSGRVVSGVDTATIHFKDTVSSDLIDRLLETDEPVMSCAGGLMVEHPLTKAYIHRIEGTEDSVMGLSKDLVLRLMKELADNINSPDLKS